MRWGIYYLPDEPVRHLWPEHHPLRGRYRLPRLERSNPAAAVRRAVAFLWAEAPTRIQAGLAALVYTWPPHAAYRTAPRYFSEPTHRPTSAMPCGPAQATAADLPWFALWSRELTPRAVAWRMPLAAAQQISRWIHAKALAGCVCA